MKDTCGYSPLKIPLSRSDSKKDFLSGVKCEGIILTYNCTVLKSIHHCGISLYVILLIEFNAQKLFLCVSRSSYNRFMLSETPVCNYDHHHLHHHRQGSLCEWILHQQQVAVTGTTP